VDVVTARGLYADVGRSDRLPPKDTPPVLPGPTGLEGYGALLIVGSWNPHAVAHTFRAKTAGIRIVYAPKGCLCRVEFERLRDMRRVPYLLLVEWIPLLLASRVLFESRMEEKATVVPAAFWRRKAVALPEPFVGDQILGEPRATPWKEDALIIGFLAEISPRKGLLELVEGLGRFRREYKERKVRLKIGGRVRPGSEAYAERVRRTIEAAGFADDVEWCGLVSRDRRDAFYNAIDFFACPSQFESFGLTLLEALWHGIPVASGPNLGSLECLPTDAPVRVFRDLTSEAISQTLGAMANDRNDLAVRARAWRGRKIPALADGQLAKAYVHLLSDDANLPRSPA
jgi:glycosyltransferase involved in cell wall biosynthesis